MSLEQFSFKVWLQFDTWALLPSFTKTKTPVADSYAFNFLFLELEVITINRKLLDQMFDEELEEDK